MRRRREQNLSQKETPPLKSEETSVVEILQEAPVREKQEAPFIEGKNAEIFVNDINSGHYQHFLGKVLNINSTEITFEKGKIILKDALQQNRLS